MYHLLQIDTSQEALEYSNFSIYTLYTLTLLWCAKCIKIQNFLVCTNIITFKFCTQLLVQVDCHRASSLGFEYNTSCSKFWHNHVFAFAGVQTKIAIIHPITDIVYPLLHHFHIISIMYDPEEQNIVCKQVDGVPITVWS